MPTPVSRTLMRQLSPRAEHDSEMLQASKGWNQRHFDNEILDKAAIAPEVMMNAGWYAMGWTDARFTTISAAVAYDVETFQAHEKRCEAHAREVLLAFAEKARQAGVAFDGQFVISDNVQQAIADMAEQRHCDLIVMASHGRHGLDALIHGSLTKSVLAHSQVPLLVLH